MLDRVREQGDLRPMSNESDAMHELVAILTSREPLYGRARAVLDTSGEALEASAEKLARLIEALAPNPSPALREKVASRSEVG